MCRVSARRRPNLSRAAAALDAEAARCLDHGSIALGTHRSRRPYLQRGWISGHGLADRRDYYATLKITNRLIRIFGSPVFHVPRTSHESAGGRTTIARKAPEYLGAAAYLTFGQAMSHRANGQLSDRIICTGRCPSIYPADCHAAREFRPRPGSPIIGCQGAERIWVFCAWSSGMAPVRSMICSGPVFLDPSREDAWDLLLQALQIQSASPEQS